MREVFIVAAMRSPVAKIENWKSAITALGARNLANQVLHQMFLMNVLNPELVDVFKIGSAISLKSADQSPAKEIAILSEMHKADSELLEKACSSGLLAIHRAAQSIWHEGADVAVAGGVDMMSISEETTRKSLTCPITGKLMFELCDEKARELGISRNEHDLYTFKSCVLAKKHLFDHGNFLTTVFAPEPEPRLLTFDEIVTMREPNLDKISKMNPMPGCNTITAASSSKYGDGAAFVALASKRALKKYKLNPLAKFSAFASISGPEPKNFAVEPVFAVRKLLKKEKLTLKDIDLFLINEAFATSPLHFVKEMGISGEKVNPRGGAIAIGHPLGMSGARLVIEAVHILRQEKKNRAVVSLCNAIDEATAALLERL